MSDEQAEPPPAAEGEGAAQPPTEPAPTTEEAPAAPPATPATPSSPTESEPAAGSFNEHDILAEQFENYLRIAQAYMKTLKRPKDIDYCSELLRRVQRHNDSKHLEVKRSNNAFTRYFLKVIKWTSENQPEKLYQCWYRSNETPQLATESRTWLEDNKSYMATKLLKDGTNLIYAAIAQDPDAGWQDGGLAILAKKGVCNL